MLRADLESLLTRNIELHPDYKILMDEYALQGPDGRYTVCNLRPSAKQPFQVNYYPPETNGKPDALLPPVQKEGKEKPVCRQKCRQKCCPAPDPTKYILRSEVEKLLVTRPIQQHPQYNDLMKTYASQSPHNGYMACKKNVL
jgi:hypothetical protein